MSKNPLGAGEGIKRVVVCSKSSVYTHTVLKKLQVEPSIQLVGLVASSRLMKKGERGWRGVWHLVRRTGVLYAGYLGVVTTPWLRLPHVPKWFGMDRWAQLLACPLHQTEDVNSRETQEFLERAKPDVVLSVHFNQIFSADALENKNYDVLNIHPGILPGNRGVDPVFFGLLRRESNFGVTLHRIEEKIDAGEVISTASKAPQRRALFSTNLDLFEEGGELFKAHIKNEPSIKLQPNGAAEPSGRYDSWPSSKMVWRFLFSGNRL
ncbi:formyltransferase family protein [Pseudovibrio exalbescens]|uniref:formyltransferase family protein n=1 Tax=Pseudovibrio exalbescens TaxID=197461 RepID=UPI002365E880|nr:formyltransferase family protein [Pseudovibrio exalbescens]MDD7911618.1 formyltransferase family protein [Pseudovibrio exalbescens]